NALGTATSARANGEVAALEKIRSYQRHRNQFLAFGLAFLMMPFAFGFSHGEVTWIMLRDSPKQAGLFLIVSAYCWISRWLLGRRVEKAST
ncbi:MAG: hypothetical protein WCQ64_01975, partial [Acidobacteriota bacterium]